MDGDAAKRRLAQLREMRDEGLLNDELYLDAQRQVMESFTGTNTGSPASAAAADEAPAVVSPLKRNAEEGHAGGEKKAKTAEKKGPKPRGENQCPLFHEKASGQLTLRLKEVLKEHCEEMGVVGGMLHYYAAENTTFAIWDNEDLSGRLENLIDELFDKYGRITEKKKRGQWKELVNGRLCSWGSKLAQEAPSAVEKKKELNAQREADSKEIKWVSVTQAMRREAALLKLKALKCVGEVEKDAEKSEIAVFKNGDKFTHAYNNGRFFPEIDTEEGMKMDGTPGLVYHGTVLGQNPNERYKVIFGDETVSIEASLKLEDKGTWWWEGWVGEAGKTKAKDIIEA